MCRGSRLLIGPMKDQGTHPCSALLKFCRPPIFKFFATASRGAKTKSTITDSRAPNTLICLCLRVPAYSFSRFQLTKCEKMSDYGGEDDFGNEVGGGGGG